MTQIPTNPMAFGVKQVNQDQFETNDFDILMEILS
jgi:hypothetical protein